MAQRTLHGLQPPETADLFNERTSYRELSEIAEQAKRRAEVARYLHFLLENQSIDTFTILFSFSQVAPGEKQIILHCSGTSTLILFHHFLQNHQFLLFSTIGT
jgi:hypothetical protein